MESFAPGARSADTASQSMMVHGQKATIMLGDAFAGMAAMDDCSIDLAIVDPPYGASSGNSWRLPQDHGMKGFGGKWDIAQHHWDRITGLENFELTLTYLAELRRVVRPTGSFFVHSTYHNAGIVNVACQMLGIEILNEIIWLKRNAFPNLANRRLTASHETIFWLHTGGEAHRKYRFNADAVKAASFPGDALKHPGRQMRTVWDIPNNKQRSELEHGKHPTQKPLRVTARLLLVAGTPGGMLLAPFAGSGTDLIAAARYGMSSIGYETEQEYFELAIARLRAEATRPSIDTDASL